MHCLLNDLSMPIKYRNHALTGDKKHLMDCHIKPDLVLLYEFEGDTDLILHRLASHSKLEI